MVRKKDPDEGTNCSSSTGQIERKNIAVYDPIIPAKASEINLLFNAHLTFAMYDPNFIPEKKDYVRQLYTPINGEKRIIPLSFSFDLVKLLKREDHPLSKYKINPFDIPKIMDKTKGNEALLREYVLGDNQANVNIKRIATPKISALPIREFSDIGVLDLYRKIPNNPKIEELITEISRDQFQIAVPENNKDIIEFMSGDLIYEEYPVFFFSKKYERNKINGEIGFIAKKAGKGEKIPITKTELEDISDMIVVGLGSYMEEKGDPRRRFLMYITPEKII